MIEVTHFSEHYGHHDVVDDATFDVVPGRVADRNLDPAQNSSEETT